MDSKKQKFFDVFVELKVDQKLQDLFQDVSVNKIVKKADKRELVVYMESEHLIDSGFIQLMEQELTNYVRRSYRTKMSLHQHYLLSEQYDLSKLTDIYKDSLLFELKGESRIAYNVVKKGQWYVENDIITIALEDSFMAKEISATIKTFLETIYEERFDMKVKVGFDYTKEQVQALEKARQHKLDMEIKQIEDQLSSIEGTEKKKKDSDQQGDQLAKPEKPTKEMKAAAPPKQEDKGNFYNNRKTYQRPKDDPDVIYGRNCEGELMQLKDVNGDVGEVVIHGQIITLDIREIRGDRSIITAAITDFTDTIKLKIFSKNELLADFLSEFDKGGFYRVKGMAAFDTYDKEVEISSIVGIKKVMDFRTKRMDLALEKRVELHLHTVMSDMDSVVDIKQVVSRAKEWGHTAMAITDHGVIQAFPIANHLVDGKDDPFKIIYGCEGYFIDDMHEVVLNENGQTLMDSYVVFDLETTGFSANNDRIIEIGAVKIKEGKIVEQFSEFVNPETPIPYEIEKLTSISDKMVMDAPNIETILPTFLEFCEGSVMVAHNADFDMGFIEANCKRYGYPCKYTVVDTVELAHILLPELGRFKLNTICKHLKIKLENHHRAVDDATATGKIFERFIKMLKERDVDSLSKLNEMGKTSVDKIKKASYYHGIILVKNEIGRVNLYRLISESHLTYFNKRPRMPKSLINKYREGLIIGSACEAGELYRAVLHEKGPEKIARIVNFYDYLEIQPVGNNEFMIASPKYKIKSKEELMEINQKIVDLGREYNKPVVATCDVHFLDPEDAKYRAILMKSKGFADAENQPPIYFRTTEEMLAEFDYLGSDVAKEVVVTNTNFISNMIEKISPVYPDKCPPEIEDSDATLTKICYDKAHEIYGPDLPEIVVERLERELHSIITNGFAVMYIIAQRLVWDSNDHGYLVGSRGSVGSSFVATMAGITEVNPLSAHYICPNCYYVDFDSPEVRKYAGSSGCDMPDCTCPKCGTNMNKEGHDIPFETFLGFKGDKEPDIDLNFSGEYQGKAHKYTEVLFGVGHAFRAGTIGCVAEKTAYGYVYNYFKDLAEEEAKDPNGKVTGEVVVSKRRCEMERLALGCTGAKRTTGQHPGGIIVVPGDMDIYRFTPIQHPANDQTTDIVTTHFEYHSIDHNLLKLDILGHDDPTMIRRLEDLTNTNAQEIKLDDQKVMSIFHNTEALGIEPEDIGGTTLGSLGIPEFGTDFVIQMLIDTKPKSFSDLVRISGLSHGTDVWLGNAQELINAGTVEISSAICCRDDIMVYLINMGLDKGESFTIMESVRKGKGLRDEWIDEMLSHGVPEWYIGSCKKIKYMFPKAHACAYVMMAWRIAYYKVNYPLAYYTAYFSIRASAFNYEIMCQGKKHLEFHIDRLKALGKDKRTAKEEDLLRDMKLVQEMYARGIEFWPLDLFKADAKNFTIIEDKIMPSIACVDGLGEKAAISIKEATKAGPFLSKEDFRIRAKVGQGVVDKLSEFGLFDGMQETNQFSFNFS